MRDRLINDLDGADLFLRNRASAKPAPLNNYDIEAMIAIAKICDKAARTLEKAIVPPCKVGDVVYSLIETTCENTDGVYTVCEFYDEGMCACKTKCPHIYRIAECLVDNGNLLIFTAKWGTSVFLTKEEAEQALKGGANE